MKKSKFIKASLILIIGGFITKILGMSVKIVLTREIGLETLGLYSLILPTYLLIISLAELSLPTALNVLISSKKYNNKNLIITSLLISFFLDFIIILFFIIFSHFMAINMLKEEILTIPLILLTLTLPFITTSNIFRSYYFAKERMWPHIISNILEDLIKLLLIILFINKMPNKVATISFIILINIISETSSIFIFLAKAPKYTIKKDDLKVNKKNLKDLFNIAMPSTLSRLVGSITYFLEPIILTYVLTKQGYLSNYITINYGIISGYVLPLILLPSFFTSAISQALIPIISEQYTNRNYKGIKRKIRQALLISLIIGVSYTFIIMFKGSFLLKLIYDTNKGLNYLLFIAPIFILHYLEHPLLSALQAMKSAKTNLFISIINLIIRTVILFCLLKLNLGFYALLISLGINIIFTCLYAAYKVNKIIKKRI